jgi:hypothetical protein
MSTRFLVQTREHGGPWKTQTPTLDLASAKGYANSLAKMTHRYGDHRCPVYPYVRVKYGPDVVFEPKPGQFYQGCIYAWNAYRENKTIERIKYDTKKAWLTPHED